MREENECSDRSVSGRWLLSPRRRLSSLRPIWKSIVGLARCCDLDYKPEQVLPHGSYLSNIGTSDTTLYEKARSAMLEECKRVEQLGLKYLNVHPGSTAKKCTKEESIKHIADAINYIHDHTSYMTIVLENTAGGGGTVGISGRPSAEKGPNWRLHRHMSRFRQRYQYRLEIRHRDHAQRLR